MSRTFDAIIITSDEPYGEMWHTQLLYADFLSSKTKVFYIDPPKKWRIGNLFKRKYTKASVRPNLFVVDYLNLYPSRWNRQNDNLLARFMQEQLQEINAKHVLLWHFDSFRSAFAQRSFNQAFQIKRLYHVIDPFYYNPLNTWLSEKADILVLTSKRHAPYYEAYAQKIMVVPQALDLASEKEHISKRTTATVPEKFAVLLGTLSEDVNLNLLYKTFSETKMNLVMIGKLREFSSQKTEWEKLLALPNVKYLGMLSPKDFYPILSKASAGLIVYSAQKQKQVSSPLKVLNYLLTGLPVITSLECEIDILLDKGIYNFRQEKELKILLEKAFNGALIVDHEAVNKRLNDVSLQHITETLFDRLT